MAGIETACRDWKISRMGAARHIRTTERVNADVDRRVNVTAPRYVESIGAEPSVLILTTKASEQGPPSKQSAMLPAGFRPPWT